jgi:hypothetical protein
MGVYDVRQLETALNLLLENRQDPSHSVSASASVVAEGTNSGGFAGSMITASRVLSSDTR